MLKNNKGFTLMEILVTVLIIAILGAIAVPQYRVSVEKTRLMGNVLMVKALQNAVVQFYAQNNEMPKSLKSLPVSVPQGNGGYVIEGNTATKSDNSCVITLSSTQATIGSGSDAYSATVPSSVDMSCTTSGGNLKDWAFSFTFKPNSSGSVFASGNYFKVQAADSDRADFLKRVAKASGWAEVGGNTYDINPTVSISDK